MKKDTNQRKSVGPPAGLPALPEAEGPACRGSLRWSPRLHGHAAVLAAQHAHGGLPVKHRWHASSVK